MLGARRNRAAALVLAMLLSACQVSGPPGPPGPPGPGSTPIPSAVSQPSATASVAAAATLARPGATPTVGPRPPVTPLPLQTPDPGGLDPRFGVAEGFRDAPVMADIGAGWERVVLSWADIQPDGPDDFSWLGRTLPP
ncbi:MAG TPA: hypothetical protein VF937_10475, partial [Chloroflexota bacterium]